jgi:uncharacterized RDD family membrane protein YckC
MSRLDTAQSVETPEGISLGLHLAGPVARFYAFVIDLLIRAALYMVLGRVLAYAGGVGFGVYLLAIFLIEWLFAVPFEVLWHGQTPGKRVVKIRVLREDGVPVGWGESVTRNLLRAADFLPAFYGFGLLSMLVDRRFRRLGDIAAGTVVVYDAEAPRPQALQLPEPGWAPPRDLTVEEQRAVMGFAERYGSLTAERAIELAEILSAFIGGLRGERAVDRLRRLATWINIAA